MPLIDFEMNHLQFRLQSKSFSTSIDVGVGGLTVCALQNTIPHQDGPLYLLKTPMSEGGDQYLLKMHMFSVKMINIELHNVYTKFKKIFVKSALTFDILISDTAQLSSSIRWKS